jgi:hypothetical protein
VADGRPARLDLSRPRTYGELLSTAAQTLARHTDVFLTVAIIAVAPSTLIVDGIWGRALADGIRASPSIPSQVVSAVLSVFVVLPLIVAALAPAVEGLGRGEAPPPLGAALRAALRRYPRVVGALALYLVIVLVGLVLVVPGIWLGVRCVFAPQAAALDDVGPSDAMRRSSELVQGVWWRTLGCLLMTEVLLLLTGSVVLGSLGATGSGAVYVAGVIVVQSVATAVTVIFATLLYYDLRARRDRAATVGAGTMAP